MADINEDVNIALEFSKEDHTGYAKYCNVYPWTNEDLGGAFSNFCKPNSRVLTVCSSGDHVLNAILYGSTDITTFDINKFTFYYLDLKMAAMESFDREEFLNFMPGLISVKEYMVNEYRRQISQIDEEPRNLLEMLNILTFKPNLPTEYKQDLFTSKTCLENLKNISKDSYEFWIQLYNKNPDIMNSHFFKYEACGHKENIIFNSNYLKSDQNYEIVKNNLSKVNIKRHWSNIKDLPKKINKDCFDLIHFSNIANASRIIFDCNKKTREEGIRKYSAFLQKYIYKLLNEDGTIILNRVQDPFFDMIYDRFGIDTENAFQYMKDPIQTLNLSSRERIYYKKAKLR